MTCEWRSWHILIPAYFITVFADVYTTILAINKHGFAFESNPFFLIFGTYGLGFSLLFSIGLGIFFYYVLTKLTNDKHTLRYIVVAALVFAIILRLSVAYGNYQTYLHNYNEEEYLAIESLSKEVKATYYMANVIPSVLFMLIGILSFILWRLDYMRFDLK